MYWRPWRWTGEQWLGAWVATLLAGGLAVLGMWASQPTVTVVGLIGIPFGALTGGRHGAAIAVGGSRVRLGLQAGLIACMIATGALLLFAILASFAQPLDAVPDRAVYLLYVALVIPVSVAIVGLPIALPLGVVGAVLVRAVTDHRWFGVLALTLVSFAVAGAGAIAVVSGR